MDYKEIFERNRQWALGKKATNAEFFKDLALGQSPDYLLIGCSDSRIPPELICGVEEGDLFVHRNIANLVNSDDQNILSVINYAVDHLKVKHIVVLGHTECGGVKASLSEKKDRALDPWLNKIRKVETDNLKELRLIKDEHRRYTRLIELNTIQQCINLQELDVIQKSKKKTSYPLIHAWIFDTATGELKDLNFGE